MDYLSFWISLVPFLYSLCFCFWYQILYICLFLFWFVYCFVNLLNRLFFFAAYSLFIYWSIVYIFIFSIHLSLYFSTHFVLFSELSINLFIDFSFVVFFQYLFQSVYFLFGVSYLLSISLSIFEKRGVFLLSIIPSLFTESFVWTLQI